MSLVFTISIFTPTFFFQCLETMFDLSHVLDFNLFLASLCPAGGAGGDAGAPCPPRTGAAGRAGDKSQPPLPEPPDAPGPPGRRTRRAAGRAGPDRAAAGPETGPDPKK